MNKNIFTAPSEDLYLTTNIPEGQLPEFLTKAISIADEPSQRDMLLLGMLTACSYAMPHVRIMHGQPQHSYYPNLMSLVVAPPAAGKGILNNLHRLMAPIQRELSTQDRTAIIPANSSSAAFLDLLALNGGTGLMVETEMDVLSQIWKADYGNYSYLFRQAFEHETIRRARKAGGGKLHYTEIPDPRLSAILSGTPNQLKPLLVSRDNGLASRFVPYLVEEIVPFDRRALQNGDHIEENGALPVFAELGKELLQRMKWLSLQKTDILWSLTDEQSEMLGDLFDDGYRLALEEMHLPTSFDSTVKRMAVTIKRIGAVLTMLRIPIDDASYPLGLKATPPTLGGELMPNSCTITFNTKARNTAESKLPEVLYCSDEDFRTLVMLSEKLLRHAALMMLMLPDEAENPLKAEIKSEAELEKRVDELCEKLPDEFGTAEALAIGEEMDISGRAVEKYLKILVENKQIEREKKGYYKKLHVQE